MRQPPDAETVRAMAEEIAGTRLDPAAAESHAGMLAAFMEEVEALRALPLKHVEPAAIFEPVEDEGGR